jgi:NAD(P)-dependent dehydrogenase (short-subunit alcohol dehydrogenase family)
MSGRLQGKIAIIVGAGQSPGETIGNGRAIALLFARHGAQVLCVDRRRESAVETVAMMTAEGGSAAPFQADVSHDAGCASVVAEARSRWGRIDILVNNVGIGGGGDGPAHRADEAAWDRIMAVNLKSAWMTIKHAVPIMREQAAGSIVNISSLASLAGGNQVAYEVSKAGMNRLTTSVANANAAHGVRCNAVLPGLMDTPMAISGIAEATGSTISAVREGRSARVPLRGKMGTAWDLANAALFFASEESSFITGAELPLDGGLSIQVGRPPMAAEAAEQAAPAGSAG